MRPSDPWLRAQLGVARGQLLTVLGAGLVSCLAVLAQAWAVAGLVLAVLRGDDLTGPAAILGGVLVARGLAAAVGDVAAARAATVVGTSLRTQVVDAAVRSDLPGTSGEVAVLTTRGVAAAEPYLTRYLPALILACLLPPLTLIAIAGQDLLSALIVALTLPLVPVFGALVGLATRDRAREQWREMASLSGHFLDVVRGLPTLVAHRRARAQSGRIAAITDRYRLASLRTLRIAFASSLVLELVATLSVALVAVTTGVRLAGGSLDLHTALVVLLLAPEAYWPLRRVGAEFHAAAEGAATFETVRDLVGGPRPRADGPVGAAAPGAALVLDSVSVVHDGRTQPAVLDVSALVPARGVTAVTGPSGCGKSTLLDALAGLLPLAGGSVTVDGRPVGGPEWQSQVAWLPQRPHIVVGTVADNLRLGRPDATDEQLWAALRQVALEERVRTLPGRLDAELGEDGATLSAGERARLALARVVVADRPWILLDEPTAHLDPLTEQVITDTIADLGREHGVVVVAHRPALVAIADQHLALPERPVPTARREPAAHASGPARVAALPGLDQPLPDARFGWSTILSGLASASGVALTATAGWLIVQASTHPPVLTMLVAIVGVRTFGLARPVLRYAERLRSHDVALRLLARRRVEVYDAVVPLVPARLGRRRGDLLASIVDDVDSVVDRELRVRLPWRSAVVVAGIASAVAAVVLPLAGLVVLLGTTAAALGTWLLARHGATATEAAAVGLRAELSAQVVEIVQLAREHRMWQSVAPCRRSVERLSAGLGAGTTHTVRWSSLARLWAVSLAAATMTVLAAVSAPAVADGTLSGSMMALLVLLPLALVDVVTPLADAAALAVRTEAAAARLDLLTSLAPAVADGEGADPSGRHDLAVHAASGSWEPGRPGTAPCSIVLAPGDRIAVVGPSGSGKSTLAALLIRFLDPVTGDVRHGGQDLRDLPLDEVRRSTGLVDDDPHVFATTVAENVRLARPGASDAEVLEALADARLGDWVAGLPDGVHTWLGDGHAGLSGGERARIGIARSLLADQPVLVLDEPDSHLDRATARRLAEEILSGERSRSVVWITHAGVGLDLADGVVDLAADAAAWAGRSGSQRLGRLSS